MSRQAALDDFLERHVFDKWLEDLEPIGKALSEQGESIETGLCDTFDTVWIRTAELQKQGTKGDIHYVYISLLRTGIMENIPCYRIDVHDHNWYLDTVDCSALWRADFIFEPLFRRMAGLETAKTAYARKVTPMDLARIQQIEAVKYHLLTVEFMKSMLPLLLNSSAYRQVAKSPNIRWMMGEFRDQSELLVDGERAANGGTIGVDNE
ncbi:hypothetical protein CF651_15285 [Paenibacillus rigui]|uniref:Uncharacterized protein n=2 Tax=Paenibacillus rigui TaxID=554312 RepID=A0A229UQ12_9BACL|nr:hypothetical protein CF651_15285 [Paenibacillus rigui]